MYYVGAKGESSRQFWKPSPVAHGCPFSAAIILHTLHTSMPKPRVCVSPRGVFYLGEGGGPLWPRRERGGTH